MFVDNGFAPNIVRKASFRKLHPNCPFDSPTTFTTRLNIIYLATVEAVFEVVKDQTTFLLLDGGSILSEGLLNVCIGVNRPSGAGSDVYFLRSYKVRNGKKETLGPIVQKCLVEIAEARGYCVAVITDNGSNLVSVVKSLVPVVDEPNVTWLSDSDSDDDVVEENVVDELGILDENGELIMDVGDLPNSIPHIRCWAHTFQLIFKDLFKVSPVVQKAMSSTTRIVRLLRCRELQFDLTRMIDMDGEIKKKKINVPAATRWNSHVRAMVRIEALFDVINECLQKHNVRTMEPSCRTAMRHAIMVMTPIAWATDRVQADTCSCLDGIEIMTETKHHYTDLIAALVAVTDHGLKDEQKPLLVTARVTLRCLAARAVMFENTFVKLVRLMDPATGLRSDDPNFGEQFRWLEDNLTVYMRQTSLRDFVHSAMTELRRYVNRPKDTPKDFFEASHLSFPVLGDAWGRLCQMILTEAHVERSFGAQSAVCTKNRNRMLITTTNAWVMLRMNYAKLFLPPSQHVHKSGRIDQTRLEYQTMLAEIVAPTTTIVSSAKQRTAKARRPGDDIRPNMMVSIAYKENENDDDSKATWYDAVVVEKHLEMQPHEVWVVRWLAPAEGEAPEGLFFPYSSPGKQQPDEWTFFNERPVPKKGTEKNRKK